MIYICMDRMNCSLGIGVTVAALKRSISLFLRLIKIKIAGKGRVAIETLNATSMKGRRTRIHCLAWACGLVLGSMMNLEATAMPPSGCSYELEIDGDCCYCFIGTKMIERQGQQNHCCDCPVCCCNRFSFA